jgi:hypothetical protein
MLDSEGRHVEIMNDILRGEGEDNVAVDRDVELINFALASGMLDLPHPLFANDVNGQSVLGWAEHFVIDVPRPDKESDEDDEWNNNPGQFDSDLRCFRRVTGSIRQRALSVANAEVNNNCEDGQSDGAAKEKQQKENCVDTRRIARVLIGQERKIHFRELPASAFFADSVQSE